jgi:hypothetical protein
MGEQTIYRGAGKPGSSAGSRPSSPPGNGPNWRQPSAGSRARDRGGHPRPGNAGPAERADPNAPFAAIHVIAAEGLPVEISYCLLGSLGLGLLQLACPAVVGTVDPAPVAHRRHPPSPCRLPRCLRRPAHPCELSRGHGIAVSHGSVELLMRRASLQGLTGRPRHRLVPNVASVNSRMAQRESATKRAAQH